MTQAFADTDHPFVPTPVDLGDLDHTRYVTWGINWSVPAGQYVKSASITFYNLYNWDANDPNVLYIHFLDSAPVGVTFGYDNQGGGDNFSGQGLLLGTYVDPDGPAAKEDKTYYIPASHLSRLADGNFGFGIDPDCHFYNSCAKVVITTACVPEPGSIPALACGFIGLGAFVRRRRNLV